MNRLHLLAPLCVALSSFVFLGCEEKPCPTCPKSDAGTCPAGSDSGTCPVCDAGTVSTAASIRLTAPGEGGIAKLDALHSFPVATEVKNFTLKDPGTCAGAANCGHIILTIDDDRCNYVQIDGGTATWNDRSGTTALIGKMRGCMSGRPGHNAPYVYNGAHKLKVELRNDDGTPYAAAGATTTSETNVTMQGQDTTLGRFCTPAGCDSGPAINGLSFKFIDGVRTGHPEQVGANQAYTARLRLPPWYLMPAHYHNTEEKAVVLEGTMHVYGGEDYKFAVNPDAGTLVTVHKFGFFSIPASKFTWFYAGPKGANIQLNGVGVYFANFAPASFGPEAVDAGLALMADGGYLVVAPNNPHLGYCLNVGGVLTDVDGGCQY
jgi:hypothetical protein